MTDNNIKACQQCFFTTSFPDVNINDQGVCSFCDNTSLHIQDGVTTQDVDQLMKVADEIRKHKKGKYDCIIGVSGGLDSSYVAYVARKIMGLNPLLVNYDHGFFYDFPRQNIVKLAQTLGCDIRYLKSNNDWDQRYVRSIIQAFSRSGLFWGICSSCHYILPAVVKKVALEEDIDYIMSSANNYEELLHVPRQVKIKAMLQAVRKAGWWRIPLMLIHLVKAQYYLIRLKFEQYVPPLTNLLRPSPKTNHVTINVTSYIPWDIEKITLTLKAEAGWSTPEHPNLGMRFDCMIEDGFINHTYKNATGSTVHSIIANNLIYAGVSSRKDQEEAVAHYDRIIDTSMEQVRQRLKI